MRKYLAAAVVCLLTLYTTVFAGELTVLRTDESRWPELTVIIEAPGPAKEAGDFTLITTENRPVTATRLTALTEEPRPASLVVAVDTSRSLTPAHLEAVKASLSNYVEALDQEEQIALLAFNDTVELAVGFTADREAFARNLDKLRPAGNKTELNRAMLYGVELLKNIPGRRTLLVLTDGKDEGTAISREQVVAAATEHGVRIYSVGIPALSAKENERFQEGLLALSGETGGRYRFAASAEELGAATREVLAAQRNPGTRAYGLTFDMRGVPTQRGVVSMTLGHGPESADQTVFTVEVPDTTSGTARDRAPAVASGTSADGADGATRDFIALLANSADGSVSGSAASGTPDSAPGAGYEDGMLTEQTGPEARGVIGGVAGGFAAERAAYSGAQGGLTTGPSVSARGNGIVPAAVQGPAASADERSDERETTLQRYWPWILGAVLVLLLLLLWSSLRRSVNALEGKGEPLVLDFPDMNRSYQLRPGTMVLGSGPDSAIRLDEPDIEAIQVEFCTDRECTVRTLLASDNVRLNGERLEGQQTLKPGDYLQFGRVRAVIRHPVPRENGTSAVGEQEGQHR